METVRRESRAMEQRKLRSWHLFTYRIFMSNATKAIGLRKHDRLRRDFAASSTCDQEPPQSQTHWPFSSILKPSLSSVVSDCHAVTNGFSIKRIIWPNRFTGLPRRSESISYSNEQYVAKKHLQLLIGSSLSNANPDLVSAASYPFGFVGNCVP